MAKTTKQPDRRRPKKACRCSHNHCAAAPGGHRLLSHSAWYEHQRQEREARAARDAAAVRELRQQQVGPLVGGGATATGPRPATLTPDNQDACVVANSPRLGSAPVGLATEGASFSDGAFSAAAANSDIGPDHSGGDDYGESDEFTWNKDLDAEAVGVAQADPNRSFGQRLLENLVFKDPESAAGAAGAEASRASVDDEQAEEVLLSEREQKG